MIRMETSGIAVREQGIGRADLWLENRRGRLVSIRGEHS
jgi:hypothetical protein